MQAIILAGGKGTRLRPFTMTIPKPLLPLGDVPIIEIVIRQLAKSGFDDIVLSLGHMAPLFTAFIGDGSQLGAHVRLSLERFAMGTAAPLCGIGGLEDDFLVMNGDLLTTMDFRGLMDTHLGIGAMATIATSRRQVKIDYGVVNRDEASNLAEYVEKPTIQYEVSMGINVLKRSALKFIPEGESFDMPQLMVAISKSGERVYCTPSDCYWQDIGRFEDYQRASEDFVTDAARFLPD